MFSANLVGNDTSMLFLFAFGTHSNVSIACIYASTFSHIYSHLRWWVGIMIKLPAFCEITSSSSPALPFYECIVFLKRQRVETSKINSTFFCQLLHSSLVASKDGKIYTGSKRAALKLAQPVEGDPRWIHRHFHPQLFLLRSMHSKQRWFNTYLTRFWLERFHGSNGKWQFNYDSEWREMQSFDSN